MRKEVEHLVEIVCELHKKGFKPAEIITIFDALSNVSVEPKIKIKWEKTVSKAWKSKIKAKRKSNKWVRDILQKKITAPTMRKIAELDNLLKLNNMMSVNDVMTALKVSKTTATIIMHRAAAKLPHIKEYREKRKLYVVREEE